MTKKLLFVCRANSGRSQMAMELYNQLHPVGAESMGTHVETVGQKLIDRPTAHGSIEAMKELGIDMSQNTRRQLDPKLLDNYDRIIVLAETKAIPDYLNGYLNAEFWHIEDPKVQPIEEVRKIRDEIKKRVGELSQRLQPAPFQ